MFPLVSYFKKNNLFFTLDLYFPSKLMYRMGTSLGFHPDYFKGQSHSIAYITRCIPAPI